MFSYSNFSFQTICLNEFDISPMSFEIPRQYVTFCKLPQKKPVFKDKPTTALHRAGIEMREFILTMQQDAMLPAQRIIYLITFSLSLRLLLSIPLFSPSHSSRLKFPSSRVLRARVNYLLHTPQSRKCQFLISVYMSSFLGDFSYIIESSRMGEKL